MELEKINVHIGEIESEIDRANISLTDIRLSPVIRDIIFDRKNLLLARKQYLESILEREFRKMHFAFPQQKNTLMT